MQCLSVAAILKTSRRYLIKTVQGDPSGQLHPPVDLVPRVLAAGGPLLYCWRNYPNPSEREVVTNQMGHPVCLCLSPQPRHTVHMLRHDRSSSLAGVRVFNTPKIAIAVVREWVENWRLASRVPEKGGRRRGIAIHCGVEVAWKS